MIRLIHKRIEIFPAYRHHKAWRIGTARWHISVPKPGSGICPSLQVGRHLFAAAWLPRRKARR